MIRQCEYQTCGNSFDAKRGDQQYCSAECWHKAQREGRTDTEYRQFVKSVRLRDSFTCRACGKTKGDLLPDGSKVKVVAHHIAELRDVPEARTVVANGMTLCTLCHEAIHGRVGESDPSLIFGNEQKRRRAKMKGGAK
jgi:5-methylcytosine-specific restriction endonuclease McrA